MLRKPIENFLITQFKEFVSQFRLVVVDEVKIGVKEKLIFEDIINELLHQEILTDGEIDLDAYGYCEIRRVNDQYASFSLSSTKISEKTLENFDAAAIEEILHKVDGSLFYFSNNHTFSLIITFSNKRA